MKLFVLHILRENIRSFGGFVRKSDAMSFKIKDLFRTNDFKLVVVAFVSSSIKEGKMHSF